MAQVPLTAPFTMTNVTLSIGVDDYAKAVSEVTLTPTPNTSRFVSVAPAGITQVGGTTEWAMTIAYAQDWKTANSLSAYLLANAGQTKSIKLTPQGTTVGDPVFTVDAVIVPGPIGGPANTTAVGSVTLQVIGQPVKTASP